MKKLSDTLYAQEEGSFLLHAHGPQDTPWCLVDTEVKVQDSSTKSRLVAMFADLEDALAFTEIKTGTSIPGRKWSVLL